VEAGAKVSEKSKYPVTTMVVSQEHWTFTGANTQFSILIRLPGTLPEIGNWKIFMEHAKSKAVSSLDDENIVGAL
jgi:hypothetical protein